MRRFLLHRREDKTGVSGVGIVAEGCVFADGTVAVRWRGKHATTTEHASMESVEAIHLHGASTVVLWCDESHDGPKPCIVYEGGAPGRPGVSRPHERLHDGWGEPNGATDVNGKSLWLGQLVRLVGTHGEIRDDGEIAGFYLNADGPYATVLGAGCGPGGYPLHQLEAIEADVSQTRKRNDGKPSYGWKPAVRIEAK